VPLSSLCENEISNSDDAVDLNVTREPVSPLSVKCNVVKFRSVNTQGGIDPPIVLNSRTPNIGTLILFEHPSEARNPFSAKTSTFSARHNVCGSSSTKQFTINNHPKYSQAHELITIKNKQAIKISKTSFTFSHLKGTIHVNVGA
jgi:hypothetical protein